MDFGILTVEELVEARDEINGLIKVKRAESRATAKADAETREATAREKVKEGSMVSFLFNKEATEGKVLRASKKTVTVEFNLNGESVKRYRKHSDILEVLDTDEDSE